MFEITKDNKGTSLKGNPAEIAKELLLNNGSLTEDDLDLESFKRWADYCDQEGFVVNERYDEPVTTRVALANLSLVGKGVLVDSDAGIVARFEPKRLI